MQAFGKEFSGICFLAISAAFCALGCGGERLPPRSKVHGAVTIDGKPLDRGEVVFVPEQPGRTATGTINAGQYELTTSRSGAGGDGAVAGWHKVRVQARDNVEPGAPSRSLIPMRYADENRSQLRFEVKSGEANTINLELTSQEQ